MAAAVPASWPARTRSAVFLLPVVYGIAALLVAAATRGPRDLGPSSYAGVSRAAYAADLVAGLGLLAAAALALLAPVARRLGVLAFAAGVLWFAPDWEGWPNGPAALRSLGAAAVPLLAVPFALLAADRPRARRLAWAGVLALVLISLARLLVRDPLLDPNCWRDCLSRSFVVHADSGLARGLDRAWETTAVVLAVAVGASVRLRRATAATVIPGALVLATVAAYAVELLRRPQEDPLAAAYSDLFYARSVAVTAVAAGVVLAIFRMRHQRVVISRLADELGEAPQPGRLGEALAGTFGDPTLEVAYWLPRAGRYVDSDGAWVDPPPQANGRVITPIVRGGAPVAVVGHDASYRGIVRHDTVTANALLDKFGYRRGADGWRTLPDGKPLVIQYFSRPDSLGRQEEEMWKKALDSISIRMEGRKERFTDLLKLEKQCKVQMRTASWIADYPDGDNFMQLLYGKNIYQSNNACARIPEYDKRYEAAQRMPAGPERDKLYREMARIIEVYAPWRLGISRYRNMMVQPHVLGYKKHPVLHSEWQYIDIDTSKQGG